MFDNHRSGTLPYADALLAQLALTSISGELEELTHRRFMNRCSDIRIPTAPETGFPVNKRWIEGTRLVGQLCNKSSLGPTLRA